jgi:hypothetical protein
MSVYEFNEFVARHFGWLLLGTALLVLAPGILLLIKRIKP